MQRNLPSPSASAWLLNLRSTDGAAYVVLRVTEDDAAERLADYLVDIGAVGDLDEAAVLVSSATPVSVAVVW